MEVPSSWRAVLIPILFDTDIGSDIDDAVALAYLLKQPWCELVGVTTVTGDVARRCALAHAICEAAGKPGIPVHAGVSDVLLHGPGQPEVPQYAALKGRRASLADWPAGTALDFMRETIRARPGEITLLTVGPLTNVALLFAADPGIPALLKEVVSMAGVFFMTEIKSEWNCRVDPVATAMTAAFTERAKRPHRWYGLDVTMRCRMPAREVRERFVPPPLNLVRDLAEVWFERNANKEITFHDPLAAAAVFKPDLCALSGGKVVASPAEGEEGGCTRFTAGPGPHRVAREVDPAAFFEEYFSVFS